MCPSENDFSKKIELKSFECLLQSVYQNNSEMFAHLRSRNAVLAKYQYLPKHIANKMRENVRNEVPPLTGFDLSNNYEIAQIMAEIHMREFACVLNTLSQVHGIAARYHEHAFDNTDAYIDGNSRTVQMSPHEMNAEQRHASQILLGVGSNYSEVNQLLKTLGCDGITMKDVSMCNVAKMQLLAQQFQDKPAVAEEAFNRLHHISKQVWSLVNMLAFSNLFRFAVQPIAMPNQDDAIFIPYIPTKIVDPAPTETEKMVDFDMANYVCKSCGYKFDSKREHYTLMMIPGETSFYLCHSCNLCRNRDPDEIKISSDD
jgi:hypothetical protein